MLYSGIMVLASPPVWSHLGACPLDHHGRGILLEEKEVSKFAHLVNAPVYLMRHGNDVMKKLVAAVLIILFWMLSIFIPYHYAFEEVDNYRGRSLAVLVEKRAGAGINPADSDVQEIFSKSRDLWAPTFRYLHEKSVIVLAPLIMISALMLSIGWFKAVSVISLSLFMIVFVLGLSSVTAVGAASLSVTVGYFFKRCRAQK